MTSLTYLDESGHIHMVDVGHKPDTERVAVARRLLEASARDPVQTAAILERAIVLREAIYRVFSAVVAARAPEAADIATLRRIETPYDTTTVDVAR